MEFRASHGGLHINCYGPDRLNASLHGLTPEKFKLLRVGLENVRAMEHENGTWTVYGDLLANGEDGGKVTLFCRPVESLEGFDVTEEAVHKANF